MVLDISSPVIIILVAALCIALLMYLLLQLIKRRREANAGLENGIKPSNAFVKAKTGQPLAYPEESYNNLSNKKQSLPTVREEEISPAIVKMRVIENYEANLEDELRCSIDDIVCVIEKFDDGYAMCINLTTGKEGVIPVAIALLGDGAANAPPSSSADDSDTSVEDYVAPKVQAVRVRRQSLVPSESLLLRTT